MQMMNMLPQFGQGLMYPGGPMSMAGPSGFAGDMGGMMGGLGGGMFGQQQKPQGGGLGGLAPMMFGMLGHSQHPLMGLLGGALGSGLFSLLRHHGG